MEGGLKKTSHESGEQAEMPEVSQEKEGMAEPVPPAENPRSSPEVSSSSGGSSRCGTQDTGHRHSI